MFLIQFKNMSLGKVGIYTRQRIWLVNSRWAQCRAFLSLFHFSFHYTIGSFSYALTQIMSFCVHDILPVRGRTNAWNNPALSSVSSSLSLPKFQENLKSRDVYANLTFEGLCQGQKGEIPRFPEPKFNGFPELQFSGLCTITYGPWKAATPQVMYEVSHEPLGLMAVTCWRESQRRG